jgi:HlyD family secretion protein
MLKFVKFVILLIVLGAVGASGWWYVYGHGDQHSRFRTVTAERGELLATINATGTIEPEEVIDIGAQVAGMILEFGRDPKKTNMPIDYNSEVEAGTVLARIDESLYKATVEQTEANMHQAEANVRQNEANLQAMRSKLEQTKRDWERVQKLGPTKALSDLDVDTAKNAYETAAAAVPAGEAAVEAAKRSVEVDRAMLKTAKINLDYCTIKAPVKGVVIDRRVNIGQTVVASLSAPSLFLLAKDLRRIQVWPSVNEADIGHIHEGQVVAFSVDAYPGERFKGTVSQIRLNALSTQNVVTYTVVVTTDNVDGRLKPYMTANVDFEIERRTNALRVPNSALRWQPVPAQVVPEARVEYMKSLRAQAGAPGAPQPAQAAKKDTHDHGRVWVEDGPFVRALKVRIGLSDGAMTEIVGGDLQEGMAVVVGEVHGEAAPSTSNPFTPQMFRGKS